MPDLSQANWLDRAIGWVNPQAGIRRARARTAMNLVRGYEGAVKARRTDGWSVASKSADGEILKASTMLRDRARDLVRNTPQGKAIVREITNNTVGAGILCAPRIAEPDKAANKKTLADVTALWQAWASSVNCDASGIQNFYGMQALTMKTVVQAGEMLAMRVRTKDAIPLRIRLLEPEYLDTSKDSDKAGERTVGGVAYNSDGTRKGYWIYDRHPADNPTKSILIPASDMAHVLDQERPGQTRGVTWMHPVILRMRDFADYEDAQLLRQKLAACFVGFMYNDSNAAPDETEGEDTPKVDSFEPGMIERLPPGKRMEFSTPPQAEGYRDFRMGVQHDIAAGAGVTYEQMTGDYSQVNYSSARMGWLAFQRSVDMWRWQMLIPQLCDKVFGWFLETVQLSHRINPEGLTADWVAPRREMIDPTKEVPATRDAIRTGIMTLSEAIRERGYEPADVIAEWAADAKALDDAKLSLDCDPRRTSAAGLAQVRPESSTFVDP